MRPMVHSMSGKSSGGKSEKGDEPSPEGDADHPAPENKKSGKKKLILLAAPLLLIPLPAEVQLLGLRGVAETALFLVLGLLAYEWIFRSWDKLPFTCSHLPGKTPVWMILAFFGFFGALALVHALLLATLYNELLFAGLLAMMLAVRVPIRRARRERWEEVRLKYEEVPEPAVHALNLLK